MEKPSSRKTPTLRKHVGVGFWIWWNRPDGTRGGPSQVWMLVLSKRRRWAYVEFDGHGVWIREDRITEVIAGSGRPHVQRDSSEHT